MVHWARKVMDERTAVLVSALNIPALDALEVSGAGWINHPWRTYRIANYPDFDICRDVIEDATFDIILAEQVLEHVPYPYRAVRNMRRMLRPRGYLLLTLPFMLRLHEGPLDCTRWSPDGLRFFLEECGFDRTQMLVESWGNRACVVANFDDWPDYDPARHSLHNEPDMPVVVWAFAAK